MKLIKALELGEDCGLGTVEEAIRNVHFHAPSLFVWDKIQEELNELNTEWTRTKEATSFTDTSKITHVLDFLCGAY